jgi:hypothetical protein
MTASGKFLGRDPAQALAAWKALPEEDRRPGAVALPERGPVDEKRQQPTPPPGGLILRVYYRNLARTPSGELQLATQKDFPHGHNRMNLDAQPNYLWLTEAEWKSLLPAEPTKGQKVRVADPIADRICLQYLQPMLTFCACSGWSKERRRGQELHLLVEDVSGENVRLRLEGFADLGAAFDPAKADDLRGPFGYEPRFLGYVDYNPKANRITRFEFVALGDTYGFPYSEDLAWKQTWRPGRHPLGVAFEMVSGNVSADRVPAKVVP